MELPGGGGFQTSSQVSMDQMLRRRGVYLLRLLVEHSTDTIWLKYVLCFEALEMETENHLVDQVWDTVAEICAAAAAPREDKVQSLPSMTWDWISAMLARVLLSETPVLRKLGLYRFLSGHTGIQITCNDNDDGTSSDPLQPVKSKNAKSKRNKAVHSAPLSLVSTDFVFDVILPSYDTLGQSVGTNMQFVVNGKAEVHDIAALVPKFLGAYLRAVDEPHRYLFLSALFSPSTICNMRLKNVVLMFEAVASVDLDFPVDHDLIHEAVQSFGQLFGGMSIVASYRERLLDAFATILSRSSIKVALDPILVLKVLALYPIAAPRISSDSESTVNAPSENTTYQLLQTWVSNLGAISFMGVIRRFCVLFIFCYGAASSVFGRMGSSIGHHGK